mmetsp:Transcript_48854/g.122073  ORF Transcript_48854/g.122073 Transcript_48854/m.122073 type:complete len:638 (+) Transcript_48854:98-2011(+)|eukprot:CAMPEP_0173437034 /NCGR_PEP_ID=MMETSP1357-20121228/17809_1 /TAXON_ID=77926 /ORGANISM="Hemiselmis rufescens, Strain PCC563" /LENGTH=637 /DNA_ID=CAMNT_0014402191 /DNA_START=56 /DNA_END=1969 /DNA_ORIENTATION=-
MAEPIQSAGWRKAQQRLENAESEERAARAARVSLEKVQAQQPPQQNRIAEAKLGEQQAKLGVAEAKLGVAKEEWQAAPKEQKENLEIILKLAQRTVEGQQEVVGAATKAFKQSLDGAPSFAAAGPHVSGGALVGQPATSEQQKQKQQQPAPGGSSLQMPPPSAPPSTPSPAAAPPSSAPSGAWGKGALAQVSRGSLQTPAGTSKPSTPTSAAQDPPAKKKQLERQQQRRRRQQRRQQEQEQQRRLSPAASVVENPELFSRMIVPFLGLEHTLLCYSVCRKWKEMLLEDRGVDYYAMTSLIMKLVEEDGVKYVRGSLQKSQVQRDRDLLTWVNSFKPPCGMKHPQSPITWLKRALFEEDNSRLCEFAKQVVHGSQGCLTGAETDDKWTDVHFCAALKSRDDLVASIASIDDDHPGFWEHSFSRNGRVVKFPHASATYGGTPLHLAARRGNVEMVGVLVAACPVQAEARDETSRTPLMWACLKGHFACFQLLCPHSKIDDVRMTICTAAEHGQLELVSLLVDEVGYEACFTQRNKRGFDGKTALELASSHGHLHIVSYLVEEGERRQITLQQQEENWAAAFCNAAWEGHLEIIKYLLELEQDTDLKQEHVVQYVSKFNDVSRARRAKDEVYQYLHSKLA